MDQQQYRQVNGCAHSSNFSPFLFFRLVLELKLAKERELNVLRSIENNDQLNAVDFSAVVSLSLLSTMLARYMYEKEHRCIGLALAFDIFAFPMN